MQPPRGAQLRRLLALVDVLRTDGYSSLSVLAQRTGVVERTIRRDLATLEDAHFAVVDRIGDDGVRRWKILRTGTCPLCSRPTPNDSQPKDITAP